MAAPYYVYGGNLLNREKYTSVVNTTYGQRRYFSSIDTDVYFGDTLIDEMVAFDFVIEEHKMPIYGYNNFSPKRIITGQKTIQGSFAINFTQTFSLKLIIDGLADSIYANSYEESQFYCGDDNQALFGKGFDITLSYGDAKGEGSYNACTQTLVGCYITSYRQAFDTSGEPILDMYTFIAKDLILSTDVAYEQPVIEEETVTDNETTKEAVSAELYKVGNSNIAAEFDEVFNYCKEHPETLGIYINPTYDYIDGKSRISMFITPHQDVELKITSLTINIEDIALSGSYSYKLDKRIDKYNMYHEMTGTNVEVGKNILKLISNGDVDSLECVVFLECNDGKMDYSIEYSTILSAGTIKKS